MPRSDRIYWLSHCFSKAFFDEICLSRLLRRVKTAGFRCTDAFWSTQANTRPQEIAEGFAIRVEVKTDLPELEKNRLLASAILGSSIPGRPARISPPKKALEGARSILSAHKINEREYWVVCAGSRPGLEIKDWGEANWADALTRIASETKAPFLFLATKPRHSQSTGYVLRCRRIVFISILPGSLLPSWRRWAS